VRAIITLGQWGEPSDIPALRPFLGNDNALLREAAATALSKMKRAGKHALEAALNNPSERVRQSAAVGLKQL